MSFRPNLTVANLQTISRKHRPWLVAWEMGWSLEKIASTWSTEAHPLSAADVETALDDLTQQPLPPVFSEQSMFQCRVDHAPEVTCAQFREQATRQGWTVESLTERFKSDLDRPHETIKRILTGASLPGGRHRDPQPYGRGRHSLRLPLGPLPRLNRSDHPARTPTLFMWVLKTSAR